MINWNAPGLPGVYLFKDARGKIIYIGKAKALCNRLANYRGGVSGKTAEMVKHATALEWIVCRNETEALVLENTLIKQHKPKFNIELKEDVRYAYLKITNEDFPRILVSRSRKALKGEKVLGPFTSGLDRAVAMRQVSRVFGIRSCRTMPKATCLQYDLGYCTGPCEGRISREEYAQNVDGARRVLAGETQAVEKQLEAEMRRSSARQDYERALQLRDRIAALRRLGTKQLMETKRDGTDDYWGFVTDGATMRACVLNSKEGLISNRQTFSIESIGESPKSELIMRFYENNAVPARAHAVLDSHDEAEALSRMLAEKSSELMVPMKGDKLELVRLAEKNAALEAGVAGSSREAIALQKALGLKKPPASIDCFDASNLSGTHIVGSCVRLADGKPDKKNYRRFKIRGTAGQDDFASIHEIVYRRYRGALEKNELPPDLVLIDGGPGQLNAAVRALTELSLDVPIASLAKREEEVYVPDWQEPLRLPKNHDGLRLLMRARDEAHRFAVKYNRKRREMNSQLS